MEMKRNAQVPMLFLVAEYPLSNSVWPFSVPCGHGFIQMISLQQELTVIFLTFIAFRMKFGR